MYGPICAATRRAGASFPDFLVARRHPVCVASHFLNSEKLAPSAAHAKVNSRLWSQVTAANAKFRPHASTESGGSRVGHPTGTANSASTVNNAIAVDRPQPMTAAYPTLHTTTIAHQPNVVM